MTRLVAVLALLALVVSPAFGQTGASLAEIRTLYARADYEGTLRLLTRAGSELGLERVEEYRALCLLALGRVREAEQAVERIFTRAPLYQAAPDASPRMVALVAGVRQRLLPVLARSLYGLARQNIEHRQYAAAAVQLKEVLALSDAAGPEAGLDDLQVLAEGFLAIAEGQLRAASVPPPGPVEARSMGSSGLMATAIYSDFLKLAEEQSAAARLQMPGSIPIDAGEPVVVRPDIYSDADRIQPPVPVQRDVPPWRPPDATARQGTHRGMVELIVSEQGNVEAASITESVHEAYDRALVEAAQRWRYRPATRNGEPVRYRLQTPVVLRPPVEPAGNPAP
jgi:protein TonB